MMLRENRFYFPAVNNINWSEILCLCSIQISCTLHVRLGTYFVYSCAGMWSMQIGNKIFYLGISLICHISVKHWLCIHLDSPTIPCIFIDYHAKSIPHFYWSGVYLFVNVTCLGELVSTQVLDSHKSLSWFFLIIRLYQCIDFQWSIYFVWANHLIFALW